MPEYKCHGCDKPINTGNVIIGRNQRYIEDSTPVILHAQGIKIGSMVEISDYALAHPDCCVTKYFDKDSKNDIYDGKVVSFSDLEKELEG